MKKNCAKCGKALRADNTKGICGQAAQCRERAAGNGGSRSAAPSSARASKRRDADDAVLERAGLAEPAEAPPTSAAPTGEKTWFDKFCELHAALGLDANEAIEEHCREWWERTTALALGQSAYVTAAPKPKPRKPRAAQPSNGASSAESPAAGAPALVPAGAPPAAPVSAMKNRWKVRWNM